MGNHDQGLSGVCRVGEGRLQILKVCILRWLLWTGCPRGIQILGAHQGMMKE